MALTTRTHRVAVTAAPQLRTRVHRVSVGAVETFPTTRIHRLSVTAVESFPRTRIHRLAITAAPPLTINLGPDRTAEAGRYITITATTDAASVVWSQTAGPTVNRVDSALSTTIRCPIALSTSTITIRAEASNPNGTSSDTIDITVDIAPLATWDGATLKAAIAATYT